MVAKAVAARPDREPLLHERLLGQRASAVVRRLTRAARRAPRSRKFWPEHRRVLERPLLVRSGAGRAGRRSRPAPCPEADRRALARPSTIARATSSAKNGLPPEASATRGARSRVSTAAAPRPARRPPRAVRGRSSIWVTFRAARPKSGRRSSSSGRLVQTTSSGASSRRKTTSSIRSRSPSSAQCASSIPITSGRSRGEQRRRAGARRASASSSMSPSAASPPSAVGEGCARARRRRRPRARARRGASAVVDLSDRVVGARAGGGAEDLAERPEGDPAAVGRVAAHQRSSGRGSAERKRIEELASRAASCRPRPRP